MKRLPEKTISAHKRKSWIFLIPLWIIIFPLICFLMVLSFYGFFQGGDVSPLILPTVIMAVFLYGITYVATNNHQTLVLNNKSIEISKGKKTKTIPWSNISHIDTLSNRGVRIIRLHLKDWQKRLETAQGKEKRLLQWKNLWIVRSFVQITSMHHDMSHAELLTTVETYYNSAQL